MTADFVAATSGRANTAANTLSVPWASTTAGDVCLLALAIGGLSAITDPAGWTAIDNLDQSSTLRTKLWWHRCDGSESGSLAVNWTGTAQLGVAAMAAWRGIYSGGNPVDAHSVTGATATATSRATTATGANADTSLQICVYCDVQTTAAQSWTPPASCQERLDTSTTASPFLGLEVIDPAALTGASAGLPARTATSAQSGTAWVGYNLGLRVEVTAQSNGFGAGTGYRAGSQAPLAVSEGFTGAFGAPSLVTTGQVWPRGASRPSP